MSAAQLSAIQDKQNTTNRGTPLKERLRQVRDALTDGLIERDTPIRLALLAALAGEHVLLIGPPGTAKSELARRLRLAFTGQSYFERLLTRFSVPEELFGPLSIKALEDDRYQRQTEGYLPTAAIAFLDEIFKANSAILNALLTLLNEREFDNGTQRIKTPLVSVVGASNELPQEEELLALYDRFLVRYHVGPVTDEGFAKLLELRGQARPAIDAALLLSPSDLAHIHAAALQVAVPAEVASLLKAMRKYCQDQKIPVSDRRWRKALFLLQVAAHTDGRKAVSLWDCWLLQHCLWHKQKDLPGLFEWYTARIGEATVQDPGQLGRHVAAWEAILKSDREQGPQKKDQRGSLLFIGADGKETTSSERYDDGRRVPNAPVIETRHYSKPHIAKRTSGVSWVCAQIAAGQAALHSVASDVHQAVTSHLWIDSEFASPAQRRIAQQMELLGLLECRARKVLSGFDSLPRKPDAPPAELATMPPTMRRAFKVLADFAESEQRKSGKPLQKILSIEADIYGGRGAVRIGVSDDHQIPPDVREAIEILQFPLDDMRDDSSRPLYDYDRPRVEPAIVRTYLRLLREYLELDGAPRAVLKRLDQIAALVSANKSTAAGNNNSRHIIGMAHAIRYSEDDNDQNPFPSRFYKLWSESLAIGAERLPDWIALGLLTDED